MFLLLLLSSALAQSAYEDGLDLLQYADRSMYNNFYLPFIFFTFLSTHHILSLVFSQVIILFVFRFEKSVNLQRETNN